MSAGAVAFAWALTPESISQSLQVSLAQGLNDSEARQRLARDGENVLSQSQRTSPWRRLLSQFLSPVVLTLLVATLISALLGEWVDSVAILTIVSLNAWIGFAQEAKAETAVEALKKLSAPKTRVLRNGQVKEILASHVCLGDVLILEAGDLIPGDARLIEGHQFSTDEAVLTGESLPIEKSLEPVVESSALGDRSNMVFAGTAVATGSGRALVTAIGMQTELGRIASLLGAAEKSVTPLQAKLAQVSQKLLLLCIGVVLVVAGVGALRGTPWLEVLMSSIALAVAAIPEGLPTVVTLALALAVRRMASRNAIIRHLPAVETLGSTDVICTDKTGTLTTGKMRARELYTIGSGITASATPNPNEEQTLLLEASVLCSNASLSTSGEGIGDPTEVALLVRARESGILPQDVTSRYPRLGEAPFDSDRKRMSVAVQNQDGPFLFTKGAPESVLGLCELDPSTRNTIQDTLTALSSQGRRVLAVASKRLAAGTIGSNLTQEEHHLSFLGLVALADPPRPESIAAIRACQSAGIDVIMITGDHPLTAQAIARELGILRPGRLAGVLTGSELEQMDETELLRKVLGTAVYARVSPEHKLRIVRAWKAHCKTVAMTGDGVNDAPALKEASIGVSMGKGGTEVARQASSMILADDHFATVVGAIEEGRAVHGNIRRTIQYLMSGNLAEILIMLGAAIAGWPVPLAPIHLLWINLVTDGLPSLALAAEPVPRDVLQTHSRPSPNSFFDSQFYRDIAFTGIVTTVLALGVYGYSLAYEDEDTARTHVFSFLVFTELFRSFSSRSETKTFFHLGWKSNIYHLVAVAIPITFQIALHHFESFQKIFRVHGISWNECLVLFGLTLVPVSLLELKKIWVRHPKPPLTHGEAV